MPFELLVARSSTRAQRHGELGLDLARQRSGRSSSRSRAARVVGLRRVVDEQHDAQAGCSCSAADSSVVRMTRSSSW